MIRNRRLARVLLTLAAVAAMVVGASAQAHAASANVGLVNRVEPRCNASPYLLCLYYNSSGRTGWWGTNVDRNLDDVRFFANTGAGSGQRVKNNSAAASCDTITSYCKVFELSYWGGNWDYLQPQWSGQLYYTYNDNASVRID